MTYSLRNYEECLYLLTSMQQTVVELVSSNLCNTSGGNEVQSRVATIRNVALILRKRNEVSQLFNGGIPELISRNMSRLQRTEQ